MGTMLAALVDAQLEGAVHDRGSAEAWIRARFATERGTPGA
jgi:hypothetical protein